MLISVKGHLAFSWHSLFLLIRTQISKKQTIGPTYIISHPRSVLLQHINQIGLFLSNMDSPTYFNFLFSIAFLLSGLLKAFSAWFQRHPMPSLIITGCYLALGIGFVVLSALKSSTFFHLGLGLAMAIPPMAEVGFVLPIIAIG
jgi:hypothetical protein